MIYTIKEAQESSGLFIRYLRNKFGFGKEL